MRLAYHILDVFTDRPLAGNPLAVVLDADGLDPDRMQAIAGEFNLSETVFVLTPRDPVNTARVRIFTPRCELPFAGHPTVGTAVLLARLRAPEMLGRQDLSVVLEEEIGAVTCTVRGIRGGGTRASFAIPKLPVAIEAVPGRDAMAAALSLEPDDIGCGAHRVTSYAAGNPFVFVPVRDREAIGRAVPRPDHAGTTGIFVYTAGGETPGANYRARMFGAGIGIAEDPATGSAAAAFAGVLMQFDRPADGDHTVLIEQGFEMGRPSLMTLGLDVENGALVAASVGGAAVRIAEGTLTL